MLDAKELDCYAVGENDWVIRRRYFDEQGRRHHQFLALIRNATTNNQEVAEEFIRGIAALQQQEHAVDGTKSAQWTDDDEENLEWHQIHDDHNESKRNGEVF